MEIYETHSEIAKRKSWLLALVVIVLVSLGVLILLQGIALALAVPLFNISIEEIMSLMQGDDTIPNGRMAMLFIQGLGSGIGFWLTAWIIIHWVDKANLKWDLQLSRFENKKFWVALGITFGGMFFNALLIYWNSQMVLPDFMSGIESWMKSMEDQQMVLTKYLTDFQTIPELIAGVLVIGVLAGIGEEMFFRGVLQPKMHRFTGSVHWGIWLSAIIFSTIHFQFYGFFPRVFLGAMFGYMYVFTGSLVYPILAHIINNTFTVFLVYISNQGFIDFDLESKDEVSYPMALVGLLVLIAGIYYLQKNKPEPDGELD